MLDVAITQALDDVARQLGDARDVDAVLASITDAARASIDEIDHVGISITHRDGSIETRSFSGDLALALDQLQYDLGEGPCLDALEASGDDDVIRVDNARHEQRWPAYIPRAVAEGLRSQLGVRIYAEDRTVGGLNLYSTSRDTISEQGAALAHLFATHAALALGRVRKETHLLEALETRTVIGQATGVVIERYTLTPARAFDYLIRLSQASNIKLRDVAQAIVADASTSTGRS